jgi:predicted alpha/beta superfamily hydrolase
MQRISESDRPSYPMQQNDLQAGQLKLHWLKSEIFGNRRMLRVWLPPAYDEVENRGRRYPVLFLNDGQNLFDGATAFKGVAWQVGETATQLTSDRVITPLVIVGIDNAGDDRIREYVPYPTRDVPVRRVQGEKYPDFLLREVMPYVRKRYRIAYGPENTGLGGSSLGGYIALYTVISRPRTFGRLLAESPPLYLADKRLLRESMWCRRWPQRVYLGVGKQETSDENRNQEIVDEVRALGQILQRAGQSRERLKVVIEERGTHSEEAWGRRFPTALSFLFS